MRGGGSTGLARDREVLAMSIDQRVRELCELVLYYAREMGFGEHIEGIHRA